MKHEEKRKKEKKREHQGTQHSTGDEVEKKRLHLCRVYEGPMREQPLHARQVHLLTATAPFLTSPSTTARGTAPGAPLVRPYQTQLARRVFHLQQDSSRTVPWRTQLTDKTAVQTTHSTVQHHKQQSTGQYTNTEHIAMHIKLHYHKSQHSVPQQITAQYTTAEHRPVYHRKSQHSIPQQITAQYTTANHSIAYHSKSQHSIPQHSIPQQITA